METAHLLRSPANAGRLLTAIKRARAGKGRPMTIEELRKKSGIDEAGR
jgi:antitoxin YefM